MSSLDEKLAVLRRLAERLEPAFSEASVHDQGSASFLYFVGGKGAAEVSWTDSERFWVEIWDSMEEYADPVMDVTLDTVDEVERLLLEHVG